MNRRAKKSQWMSLVQNVLVTGTGVVVFCVFVFMTIWSKDGLVDLMRLSSQKDQIESDNRGLLQENLSLIQEIQSLKNAGVLEQKARSELGLVKPNEIVLVLDPS